MLVEIKYLPAFIDYGNSKGTEVAHSVEVEAISELHLNWIYIYDNVSRTKTRVTVVLWGVQASSPLT